MNGKRTPAAEDAARRAMERIHELMEDPAECVALFEQTAKLFIAPELWDEALATMKANMLDDQFRLSFVLWVWESFGKLYREGKFDWEF